MSQLFRQHEEETIPQEAREVVVTKQAETTVEVK